MIVEYLKLFDKMLNIIDLEISLFMYFLVLVFQVIQDKSTNSIYER